MSTGVRVGRLFGIDIRVDWSWFLIFFLIVWNLSALLASVHGGWSASLRWGLAVVAALAFFASVLAHELAHSLVARARGIPVRGITLFLFGGVSNIQREPASAASEFLMAIVGPLSSLIIGGVLLWLAGALAGPAVVLTPDPALLLARLGPLAMMLLWLGSVNIILGIFNLVPGFPLDGGRVLRSLLWALLGDLRRATRWASWVGQGIAWLMIVSGISMIFGASIPFLGSGLVNGLWLAFIGWFLNNAAAQSYQQVVLRDVLEGLTVARLMRTSPPTCAPGCTVSQLVHEHVMGSDDQAFPVLRDGAFIGLVTLTDVRRVLRERWDVVTVQEIMTPVARLVTVAPDDEASLALARLAEHDVRQLPVIANGQLVGLFRRSDVVKWLQWRSAS
jgi:Zn-dependent protease/CBS domain-containing protein